MIRAPHPSETDALVAIGEATRVFNPGETDALLRATLDALHAGELGADHEVRVWADPADDTARGWVYFAPKRSPDAAWELYWIGVDPARQGAGIGKALLTYVEQHVARAGGRVLIIETSSHAPLRRARQFYADHGYTLRDRTPDHYGRGEDRLTFDKPLSAHDHPTRDGR